MKDMPAPGTHVRVNDGPTKGWTGKVVQHNNNGKIRVRHLNGDEFNYLPEELTGFVPDSDAMASKYFADVQRLDKRCRELHEALGRLVRCVTDASDSPYSSALHLLLADEVEKANDILDKGQDPTLTNLDQVDKSFKSDYKDCGFKATGQSSGDGVSLHKDGPTVQEVWGLNGGKKFPLQSISFFNGKIHSLVAFGHDGIMAFDLSRTDCSFRVNF